MSQLSTQKKENGVIAWSAGNHAQGVALAAKKAGESDNFVFFFRVYVED